jgi:hypothetical protein
MAATNQVDYSNQLCGCRLRNGRGTCIYRVKFETTDDTGGDKRVVCGTHLRTVIRSYERPLEVKVYAIIRRNNTLVLRENPLLLQEQTPPPIRPVVYEPSAEEILAMYNSVTNPNLRQRLLNLLVSLPSHRTNQPVRDTNTNTNVTVVFRAILDDISSTDALSDTNCPVCYEEMSCEDAGIIQSCRHVFHRECIDTWCNRNIHHICPMCRSSIRTTVV